MQDNAHEENPRKPRIAFFDSLRGFTIISMVAFHAAYDAVYLYGFEIPWFTDPIIQTVWRSSISWVFLALAGWMTSLSRNNLKRGGVYAAAAGAVFLATSIAGVDTPISFGIIYCMAACTLLYAATAPLLNRFPAAAGLIGCLVLFAATYTLPHTTYPVEGLAWLGFPSASFVSGDYYPLLPNVFLYLAGAFAARWFDGHHASGYPTWMMKANVPFLSMIGKLSLPIYLVHQPLLILIFTMLSSL